MTIIKCETVANMEFDGYSERGKSESSIPIWHMQAFILYKTDFSSHYHHYNIVLKFAP